MTDIVERLRGRRIRTNADALDLLQVCDEAADEIERLRRLADELERRLLASGPDDDWEERGAAQAMRDEIERLRVELTGKLHTIEAQQAVHRADADEIDRLRELKTPASRELLNITKGCLDDAEAEIERLRAEIELLRAAQERLRDEIKENCVDAFEHGRMMGEQQREIDRLRARLVELGNV